MDRTEIEERMRKVISSVVKHEDFEVKDELTAKDVAGWDSLSHIAIIAEIEKTFGITFKLRDLTRMNNVGNMITLIQSRTEAR